MKALRIICLVLLTSLAGCNKPAEDLSGLEDEVTRLRGDLEATKKLASKLREELKKLAENKDNGDAMINRLTKAREEFEAQLLAVKTDLMHHRNAYRDSIRQRAPGMKLDNFDALGKTFSNVEVKEVDDWELSFKHSNGFTRIDFADAPPEIRILFAYNPNVGPKPEKIRIAAAQPLPGGASAASPIPGGSGASASGGGSGGNSRTAMGSDGRSSGVFNDPFDSSRPQTVGAAMGEPSNAKPVKRMQATTSTAGLHFIKLPDGSSVEVIHGW